jgi:hypothetical protein
MIKEHGDLEDITDAVDFLNFQSDLKTIQYTIARLNEIASDLEHEKIDIALIILADVREELRQLHETVKDR